MRELLYPMRLYNLDSGFVSEELKTMGAEFDTIENQLEIAVKESVVSTAEDFGLANWESLFPFRVFASSPEDRRSALSALIRIDGESFTLEAINDTLAGSGIVATAREIDEPMVVQVRFPFVKGVPEFFEAVSERIAEIIPCHLETQYKFYYTTWLDLLELAVNWAEIEGNSLNWEEFENVYVRFL